MNETFLRFCDASERELAYILSGGIVRLVGTARNSSTSWHPNGFVVFDLGRHPLGSLRLHIWPVGVRQLRDAAAHVHTHVWDLCSTVLAGVYYERMYEPVDNSAGEEYRSADIDYARDRNTLSESGVAFLRPSAVVTVNPGEVHTVEAGVAHETLVPDDAYAATLLLTSEPRLQRASVYFKTPYPSSHHARRSVNDSLCERLLTELEARVPEAR